MMRLFGCCAAVNGIALMAMRLFAAVIGGGGNQPERLNAEGFSPSALSRGGRHLNSRNADHPGKRDGRESAGDYQYLRGCAAVI